MTGTEQLSEQEIITRVTRILDALGPFQTGTTRAQKWRTTDQLANELELFGADQVTQLDNALRLHEAKGLANLAAGRQANRKIRRAKYPDRTTALPLWGSVKHHGEPWSGHRPDRSDPADDLPRALAVPAGAPNVFLSHTHDDAGLALQLAEALAASGIGSWRFETHIDQRGEIAKCVHEAIDNTDTLVALVTRTSIASLWVLTELHTALKTGKPVTLVLDGNDLELLKLLESARFPHPDEDFDLDVSYDRELVQSLRKDYAKRQSESRTERFENQVHDFMATIPFYLKTKTRDQPAVWEPAFVFPHPPRRWSGTIALSTLDDLPDRIAGSSASS